MSATTRLDRLRLRAASAILAMGEAIAPRQARKVMRAARSAGAGIPAEIDSGHTGGLVIIAWHVTDEGRRLAEAQEAACLRMARSIREIRQTFANAKL